MTNAERTRRLIRLVRSYQGGHTKDAIETLAKCWCGALQPEVIEAVEGALGMNK